MSRKITNNIKSNQFYFNKIRDRYFDALLNGQETKALASINYALTDGLDILNIYKKLIAESIKKIGDMWHNNEITISHEHRASQITLNILTYLRSNLVNTPSNAPLAIVSTVEGDAHIIGARILADVLLINNWNVDFLGTDTPSKDLLKFIKLRTPELLVLSGTLDSSFNKCKEITKEIKTTPQKINVIWSGSGITKKYNIDKNFNSKNLISKHLGIETKYCPDFLDKDPSHTLIYVKNLSNNNAKQVSTKKLMKIIGTNIQYLRSNKNLSQQELATKSKLDRTFLSAVENGKRNISISALQKISISLEREIDDLFKPLI
tara:strand:- start:552 stop:1511 length:960 start_codon:yes stop_codon:yes gene_type:complete